MASSDNNLPTGTPNSGWSPEEIVVCYLTLGLTSEPDPTYSLSIDTTNSGIYGISVASSGINAFADSIRDGTVGDPPSSLYSGSGSQTVVIENSCYIIFALENGSSWQFTRGVPAITMGSSPSGKYSALLHVQAGSNTPVGPSNSENDGCIVAFFSAYVTPNVNSTDPYSVFVEILQSGQYTAVRFDPDIKNNGRPP